jgi:DNA-binding transcriptional LysR family regulator
MELRHLRYFTAVAEHLNFSEASRRIHVSQPSISQTVVDLEDELGVRLLFRDRRVVRLTAAGETFRHEALEILRRNEDAIHLTKRAAATLPLIAANIKALSLSSCVPHSRA